MTHKQQPAVIKSTDDFFRLNPLTASVRVIIASGLLAGSSVSAVSADSLSPLPVPTNIVPLPAEVTNPQVDIPNLTTIPHQIIPVADQALHGQATAVLGDHKLTVNQITDKAIIDWKSFNVDKGYTVNFVQPSVSAIALNNIHQADASQIMGSITANGQVYLYNQNGFVFGKDSVVNTNSLLASTLQITDEVFSRGMTRVFDENGSAALVIEPKKDGASLDPKTAKILIEAGAKIHTDKSGRIIIVAPKIENKGSLSSEAQGQIIMAASQDKVYLQAADASSPFAGLLVEVETGGSVSNVGDVLAKQGNITMAGFAVNQQGRLTATTSVNVNGSIRLLAEEAHSKLGDKLIATKTTRENSLNDGYGQSSTINLSSESINKKSITQVVPDDMDGGKAIDEQTQQKSYIEAKANVIDIKDGTSLIANGGKVDLIATDNLSDPLLGHSGRIYVDKNSIIDVSGVKNILVPMERNIGEISVQSYELRDSPLQRTGVLKGQTVYVDLRKDTKIIDTSGALARITRGIEERLSDGGVINLKSSGDVIFNQGSKVDISGGSIKYETGYINTTRLIDNLGRVVDISDADPNLHYSSIYGVAELNHNKWGVSESWNINQLSRGQQESGYNEGKSAGTFNVSTPTMLWSGKVNSEVIIGDKQRIHLDTPKVGVFNVDLAAYQSFQNVVLQSEMSLPLVGFDDPFPKKPDNTPVDLIFTDNQFKGDMSSILNIKTWGAASVGAGSSVNMGALGGLSIEANNIVVDGNIKAAGGDISLLGRANFKLPLTGQVTINKDTSIDVSGLWVNDFKTLMTKSPSDLIAIDGGSITIKSDGNLNLITGSKILSEGGAWLSESGKLAKGAGGTIDIEAIGYQGTPSNLYVNSQISALSLAKNGSLTLSSKQISLDNINVNNAKDNLSLLAGNGVFDLLPIFGFREVNLNANTGDLKISSGVNLNLTTQNYNLQNNYREKITGSKLSEFTDVVRLTDTERTPITLNLRGSTGVTIEKNSTIILDKNSNINVLTSSGSIYDDGLIKTPGGNVSFKIDPSTGLEYDASQAIWFGKDAVTSVIGDTRFGAKDALGHQAGDVLDGGNVSIDALRGYVILESGSIIDVSGTSSKIDIQNKTSLGGVNNFKLTQVSSDAGKVSIAAAEGIVLDGNIKGHPGSIHNHGAQLELKLDRSQRKQPVPEAIKFPDGPLDFYVVQNNQNRIDQNVRFGTVLSESLNGKAFISADKIKDAEISDLRLFSSTFKTQSNHVNFIGDVNLTTSDKITIDTQGFNWVNEADIGKVTFNTNYLSIGSSQSRDLNVIPTDGLGVFESNSKWTLLNGVSVWNGFSDITLNSEHDLQVNGVRVNPEERDFIGGMVSAASMTFSASQIYPTTLSSFTFESKNNPNGFIEINGGGEEKTPISAGGNLSFKAPIINQNGSIKAPLGKIFLNATNKLNLGPHSYTSVSAKDALIPFGIVAGGIDWLYPLDSSYNLIVNNPPEKQVVLKSPDINLQKGSEIDISGGGNLQAYEFLPGSGGSSDYLKVGSKAYENSFAILPALGSNLAPIDHFLNSDIAYDSGKSIYLRGSDQLKEGFYSILPAHYSLLPGAFLVTPQIGTKDQNYVTHSTDGSEIVPGYQVLLGSNDVYRNNGFKLETTAQVKLHSQYDIYDSNKFYTNYASKNNVSIPLLPVDNGQISLIAQTQLLLNGIINSTAIGGRGAKMDIVANDIHVVNKLSADANGTTLELLDSQLENLKVDSLMLGGSRLNNFITGSTDVSVSASTVTFDKDVNILMSDMSAVAKEKVEIKEGANLEVKGAVNTGDSIYNFVGDGALLRLSSDKQIIVNRFNTFGNTGQLVLQEGSNLKSNNSMLLDASQLTVLKGDISMDTGSLSLNANEINMGSQIDNSSNALNLTNLKLSSLKVNELILNSKNTLNILGSLGLVDSDNNFIKGSDGRVLPINLNTLTIKAPGLNGQGDSFDNVSLNTERLILSSPINTDLLNNNSGYGLLNIASKNILETNGHFSINGFNGVALSAVGGAIIGDGQAVLKVNGDLNLNAGYITTTSGSNLKIDNSGHDLIVQRSLSIIEDMKLGLAGSIDLISNKIGFSGNVILPSGNINLHALTSDLTLENKANIDVSGIARQFADKVDYTAGGNISLISDFKSVLVNSDVKLNTSQASTSVSGGVLSINAPHSKVKFDGQLNALGGSASFDVNSLNGSDFDNLMAVLNNAGISKSIYFRSRESDIIQNLNNTIKSTNVDLVADHGKIDLSGKILSSGINLTPSRVNISAGDNIILRSNSEIRANGVDGGKVILSSLDNDNDGLSGIEIQTNSLVDVSDDSNKATGAIIFQALRTAGDVNVLPVDGVVKGTDKYYVEAFKKYTNLELGNDGLGLNDINLIKNDTDAYMVSAHLNNVNGKLGGGTVTPGVEINYEGTLNINQKIDLVNWRYNNNAGDLIIKASNGLIFNETLTDGFKDVSSITSTDMNGISSYANINIVDKLQSGNTWSYTLVSGSDLASADNKSTSSNNNLIIGSGAMIRTGSGDISVISGGNITFTDGSSSIYNAGKPTDIAPYGSLSSNYIQDYFYSEFPEKGGDLSLVAGGDINGSKGNSYYNDWLLRLGKTTINPIELNANAPTIWGVALGYLPDSDSNPAYSDHRLFQQNIGSFGGGNVSINARGNVSNLDVMMPTTGKQFGNKSTAIGALDFEYSTNVVEVNGGGNLQVTAGLDVKGGTYFLGKGDANFTVGGSVVGSGQLSKGPQLLLGDSSIKINATKDINITGASDPMILGNSEVNFFSYSDDSSLSIKSISGNINLSSDATYIANLYNFTDQKNLAQIYPASLNATAFDGGIDLKSQIVLYPSNKAELNLLANKNITSKIGIALGMSDADKKLLPDLYTPINAGESALVTNIIYPFSPSSLNHSLLPIHSNDDEFARVVTRLGNIENVKLNLAKKSFIKAGKNIKDISLEIQNINKSDSSIIEAGNDLVFTSGRNATTGALLPNSSNIEIGGPGQIFIKAGNNIDLGSSNGIATVGNLYNHNLDNIGSNISILAGANGQVTYAKFIDKYINQTDKYHDYLKDTSTLIVEFMSDLKGEKLTYSEAFQAFSSLKDDQYSSIEPKLSKIVMPILFNEVREAGTASAGSKLSGNEKGYVAISTLFEGTEWKGDLSLFFSKIQTISGGDINLLVPGGQINAGLAVAFTGAKPTSELGIVAQREGQINVVLKNDFLVNQSRVFALNGGDIQIWSSEGDIDAGRGAKSAISAPPPKISFDKNGNMVIEFPPIVSGSGIRTASSTEGKLPGDVYLFAPKGVVDAGEAGIGGNNVTISATAVLGANNISVGGVGTGVPQASSGSIAAGLTGTSNMTASVSQAGETAAKEEDEKKKKTNSVLGMLSVDLLGFGE